MKKNNKRNAIIIVVLLITVSGIVGTSAKYIYNSAWSYYLTSKGFYFESNLLDINTKKNSILNWDGSDISFSLTNVNSDSLISEFDIQYKVSCEVLGDDSSYLSCDLNNTGKSSFEGTLASSAKCTNEIDEIDVSKFTKSQCEVGGYTWEYDVITKENTFNLNLTDSTKSIDEASVKITVESTKPYKKTLIGIFNLNKVDEEETNYIVDYQSYDEYDELTIVNKTNSDKCFLIGFDSNQYSLNSLEVNAIEYYTDENNKINGFDIKIANETSDSFEFFRMNDTGEYSVDNFVVSEKEC